MTSPSLRDKLGSEVLACRWAELAPHHARQALLVVRPDLDLLEAALAVAEDRVDRLEVWLAVGRIGRVDAGVVERWTARSPRFQAVIVQPYVLAQELPTAVAES